MGFRSEEGGERFCDGMDSELDSDLLLAHSATSEACLVRMSGAAL